ncbi:MAG: AAA family ATPase [Rubrivivax sp.]|nr:AAA family ATPase [Rubrivivax sp.]
MKILQIRGRNLASLAGDFNLDFESGPLAETGLFAISGPTGAGKSTLLDALSLALYDRTPRLESNSGYQIPDGPDESLGVHDTRNLLRRGTADGLAEVRFVGTDGRRYRASWSVRRARNKVGGKLQQSELQLFDDESSQSLGRTKTEVLAATERAVGLTFDQFRRSILLAQGDFAAFLKAKSDERSELLERMTGTELYSAISKRAFAKAKEIEESLRRQEEGAKAIPILEPEARSGLMATVNELGKTVSSIASRLAVLREQMVWWTKATDLRNKLAQARERLAAAAQRWTDTAPRREALADLERVQSLRAIDKEATRTAAEHDSAEKQLKAAEAVLTQARSEGERSASTLAQASKDREQRRVEAEAIKPQIDKAKSLDQAIAEKKKAVDSLDKKLAEADKGLAELTKRVQTLGEQRAIVAAELEKQSRWLEANGALVALSKGWSELVAPQLLAFERTHGSWKVERAALPALREAHGKAVAVQVQAQKELAANQAALAAAKERVQAAEAAEAAHPATNLAERRGALEGARARLTKLVQSHEHAVKADKECRGRQAEVAKVRTEAAEAENQSRLAAAARGEIAQQLARTERLLIQLGLDAHRAQLVEGEPCPLCGSTHHPGMGPIEATVAVLETQKREQIERQSELERRKTAEKTRGEARRGRATELEKEIERWQGELDVAEAQWQAMGGQGHPVSPDSKGWLDAQANQVTAESTAIAEQERALEGLRNAAADARKAHEEVTGRVEQARSTLTASESVVGSAIETCNRAAVAVASHRNVLDAAIANLAHAFPGSDDWRIDLEADPKAFGAKWSARVEEARRITQTHADSRKQLADIDTQREVKANALKQSTEQRAVLDLEGKQHAAERDALVEERREVLQGKPVGEVESASQTALQAAEQAYVAADEKARLIREDLAKKEEAHELSTQKVALTSQAKELAAKALGEALVAAGLDAATLRARLRHEEQWIHQERAALAEIDRLHSSENKAFEERNQDLLAHEAQLAPDLPLAEIETSLATREREHGELSQQLGAAKQRLEQDNQNRAVGEAKSKELEQARKEAKVWQQLDELIGSADGRKFRKFAQSMTMELLLAHANHELASLAPRYVLQRVKAQDLELQVLDRDMGDEIRSTSSLSGGETFLVSLALALGLSSLASDKVRIESLFIDEGFGSLDLKTLETALSTLDSLQSAGRKVGLISHVPGLAERIGVQVLVERQGQGASTVRVVKGTA